MIWPVVDDHRRLERALVRMMPVGVETRVDARDFLVDREPTVPPSVICGLTRSVRPTSLRSNVWNGVTVVALPVVA